MSKKLIAYFSVSGATEKVAKELAKVENADLFAIIPVLPYTKEDLDYTNPNSRSSVEMKDLNCRPALSAKLPETGYDTVFVGFPIWWGREPSAVDTFLYGSTSDREHGVNTAGIDIVLRYTRGGYRFASQI